MAAFILPLIFFFPLPLCPKMPEPAPQGGQKISMANPDGKEHAAKRRLS